MESSAPKRRKTSSNSSVSVNSQGSASSDGATRRSTRRRRPSFASPTKASLARANPDILERRSTIRSQRQLGAPEASSAGSPESVSEQLRSQLGGASETHLSSERGDTNDGAGRPVTTSAEFPQSPIRRLGGGMGARPRRTPTKPSPRPLPPPSAQEEELIDPFKGRKLRRSPPPGVLPATEPEEPGLPPTPTEKGISDPAAISTLPMGIHNTPTKRPRRSKALAEKIKSSPLKQPPLQPSEFSKAPRKSGISSQLFRRPSRTTLNNTDKPIENAQTEEKKGTRKAHPARGVKDFDSLADKKALKEYLLAEVAQLEADLRVARKENDRIYQLHLPHTDHSVFQQPDDGDALLEVLRHTLAPEKEPPPEPLQNWLDAAINPMSFIPFGNPALPIPTPFDALEQQQDERPPPISHHPIPMGASEELPYLQLFTPLTFTSSVSLLPRDSDDGDAGPLMQKHYISVSSTPRGLFAAKIEMTVNTKYLSIAELSVPRLDPTAVPELSPFIEKIVQGGSNSAQKRNVSVIAWAMAEWTRLATKRARFWVQIERELGSREEILKCVKKLRKSRKRKGVGRSSVEDDDGRETEEGTGAKKGVTKADLLPLLGRSSYNLDLGDVGGEQGLGVRVSWPIEFDWTGEGQSMLALLVEMPGKWHAQDDRGSLVAMPAMFDKLVQGGVEPMDAMKTIVALLVGERSD
ncbi:uncharacterized protein BCR38DRAFT_487480 [Pseudomassariella vexata]|uniref:Uncharacterized protein n=1 Tax=Pseudomassariella vexata TaxID=1141098 RepID=A0A1Y2DR21_9PEZI|nr:uncharacterized protein BCR38DRAFT_487480 [Pseudomassariella vexata]ORY61742.1 hypothetical protein BCR38DRAFT_487480 [Pseudomassariella vexata]